MADELPPYSGEQTACAKCGHHGARTRYLPELDSSACVRHELQRVPVADRQQERLCRDCPRCGYHWCEAVVEPGADPDGDVLPPDRQVAAACRALYNQWTRNWVQRGDTPDRQRLHHELYCAILGEMPKEESRG